MLRQVFEAERITGISGKSALKISTCFFVALIISHICRYLDYSKSCQRHRVSWVVRNSLVHAKLRFRQISEPEVAKTDSKPNVRGRPGVVLDHSLELGQTLLDVPLVKLDYCLS